MRSPLIRRDCISLNLISVIKRDCDLHTGIRSGSDRVPKCLKLPDSSIPYIILALEICITCPDRDPTEKSELSTKSSEPTFDETRIRNDVLTKLGPNLSQTYPVPLLRGARKLEVLCHATLVILSSSRRTLRGGIISARSIMSVHY